MLTHFFGAEKTELITTTMKLFMLGAVARVFKPGTKFETSMCLVGGQGVGKSTFFKFLAIRDEWFTDDLKNLSDDIERAEKARIKLINLFTEPIQTKEILDRFFPNKNVGANPSPAAHYDMHTKYACLRQKTGPYL